MRYYDWIDRGLIAFLVWLAALLFFFALTGCDDGDVAPADAGADVLCKEACAGAPDWRACWEACASDAGVEW